MTIYKEDALIGINETIETIEYLKPYYINNKCSFGITFPTPGSTITDEARAYWSTNEFIQNNTKALAVVYSQLSHRLIISMYIKFNKPKTPINVFKNIDLATKWLTKRGA